MVPSPNDPKGSSGRSSFYARNVLLRYSGFFRLFRYRPVMNEPQSNESNADVERHQSTEIGWLYHKSDQAAAAGSRLDRSGPNEFEIALQARDAAVCLSERDEDNPSVLILKRVEVLLLIRAVMRLNSLDYPTPHLSEEDWRLANQVDSIRNMTASLTVNQAAALKAILGRDAEFFLVGLGAKQRRHLAGALRRAAQSLNEALTRGEIRTTPLNYRRWAAIGAVTALSLILLMAGLVKAVRSWQKPNLALLRPVKISSQLGPEYGNGERLVDGDATKLGFHTQNEPNPYAIIDLGESKIFTKVIVHNRTDCCQERAVPLRIEVSDNGKTFRAIAERREVFDEWIAKDLSAKGRFVRLQLQATGLFHLAEVEIY